MDLDLLLTTFFRGASDAGSLLMAIIAERRNASKDCFVAFSFSSTGEKGMRKVVSFVNVVCFVIAALIAVAAFKGSVVARDRSHRVELTANQIVTELDAHIARIKADLHLTPEQEEKWSGFESAVHDIGKKRADRLVARRAERSEQKSSVDFIGQMRQAAVSMSERSAAEKQLADAAQPVYASLDDQQKRRFSNEMIQLIRALGLAQ